MGASCVARVGALTPTTSGRSSIRHARTSSSKNALMALMLISDQRVKSRFAPSLSSISTSRSLTLSRAEKNNTGGEEGSGDFVTDLVGKIFGKEVLADPEPFGLKRMTKDEWPDQWPAVTDAWAEPLESDEGELVKIRPLLKQTQMEFLKLGLAYDAKVHGWSASSFHTQLDGQGAGLLVAVTEKGTMFGGYNPRGWLGYGEWRDAISAFLFCFDGSKPFKVAKIGGSGMAIIDETGQGPQWGPDGLAINLQSQTAKSRLGTYYEQSPYGKSLFKTGPSTPVALKELRVYVAVEETELAKNYKPNALQWGEGELEEIRKNDSDPDGPPMDGFFGKLFGKK